MNTKRQDRANNPNAGEVAYSDFPIDPSVKEKMFLDDGQYAAIGRVTVSWGQVEADVSASLFLLRGLIGSEEEAALIDNAPLEKRLAQLKEELGKKDDAGLNAAIQHLIAIADDAKWKRDALAHGTLLFDQTAAPSFHLTSRKKEYFLSDVHTLAAASSGAQVIARQIFVHCITAREDRRGTPLHWTASNINT